MKITIGFLICLAVVAACVAPVGADGPADVTAADMGVTLVGPTTVVPLGRPIPIRLLLAVGATEISVLETTISYRLHLVDVATKRAYDAAPVEDALFDMPHGAMLDPGSPLSVAKYVPPIARPGTYAITATNVTVHVVGYDIAEMGNTNSVTVHVARIADGATPLSQPRPSIPIVAGTWRCTNSMSPDIYFYVHYGRDGQGYYGRPGRGHAEPVYYFLDGANIVERSPNNHAVSYPFTLDHDVLERGAQTFWHEGGFASQPDVGTDTCRRIRLPL